MIETQTDQSGFTNVTVDAEYLANNQDSVENHPMINSPYLSDIAGLIRSIFSDDTADMDRVDVNYNGKGSMRWNLTVKFTTSLPTTIIDEINTSNGAKLDMVNHSPSDRTTVVTIRYPKEF